MFDVETINTTDEVTLDNYTTEGRLPRRSRKRKVKVPVHRQESAARKRKERMVVATRTVLTVVNVGLIAVSMNDIADTLAAHAHMATWQAYAMAGAVDVNYIGMEFAGMFAPTPAIKERVHKWTRFAVPVIAAVSALCNMAQLTQGATSYLDWGVGLVGGAFIPAVAYVTNRVLGTLYDR